MEEQMKALIADALPDADVIVQNNGPGHYVVKVVSSAFEGKRTIAQHRLVLSALKPVMAGTSAPVHAIDRLITESK